MTIVDDLRYVTISFCKDNHFLSCYSKTSLLLSNNYWYFFRGGQRISSGLFNSSMCTYSLFKNNSTMKGKEVVYIGPGPV